MVLTHSDLVACAVSWLSKPYAPSKGEGGHTACAVVIGELVSSSLEIPDAIGWHSGLTTLVECKVSRSDFFADRKKWFRSQPEMGLGFHRYYMAPKGLIKEEELPDGWGLIEVSDKLKTRVIKASSRWTQRRIEAEVYLLLSLLRRLDIKDPGNHIMVKGYTIQGGSDPKARFVINQTEELDA
jgi:hypothetical protein